MKKILILAVAAIGAFFVSSCEEEPVPYVEITLGDAQFSEDKTSAEITVEYIAENVEVTEVGITYQVGDATELITLTAEAVGSPFTVTISDLEENTSYEYRAYVNTTDNAYQSDPKTFETGEIEKVLAPSELAAILKTLEDGAALAEYGDYVEGIVTANNEGGNLYRTLIVEDGTGEPGSGIYLYDEALNEGFAVGDEVRIALVNATLDNYSGLLELKWSVYDNDVTVVSSGNTFTTPEITAEQLNSDEYQAMYVKVTGLKLDGDVAVTWSSDNSLNFTDGTDTVSVRTTTYATWKDKYVNPEYTGTLGGVAGCYNNPQLMPVTTQDVEAFFGEEPQQSVEIEGTAGDGVYTSSIDLTAASVDAADGSYYNNEVSIDGTSYPAIKLGTGSKTGAYTFNLGKSGNSTLTLYAVAWKGAQTNVNVIISGGGTIEGAESVELKLVANDGLTGNSPFTITFGDKDFYTLNIEGATDATTIKVTTEGMASKRAVFCGVNVK